MAWDRQTRGLTQRKQEKPQIKKHHPLKSEGNDGSISIRSLSDGVFLFFKGLGSWFQVFNNKSHMIPDKPNVYDIGSSKFPWRKGYFSTNSIHIGDTKSSRLTVGMTGEGENVQLEALTPSGNVAPYASSNLQYIEGDVVLDNSAIFYNAIDGSSIASTGDLTIQTNSEFNILSKDPSVEEEARIDNRLRFDAEVAYSISNLQTKHDWLLNEVALINKKYYNRLIQELSDKNILSAGQKTSLTQPESRKPIGGTWTFDYTGGAHEDLWTSSVPHGLISGAYVVFLTSYKNPLEFRTFEPYKVVVKSDTTIQLKRGARERIIEGTSDTDKSWTLTYAYDPNGNRGGLPWDENYFQGALGNQKPDLVDGETYISGGVCSVSKYHTKDSCLRGGGIWHDTRTI